ncbi:MAG: hypothetical protein U1E12_14750 [Hydrogenophaga sp.]|uniref:hypothetical protein n=1 Tax=Hydrogenophaga sp. TaxID=1904254 RepID=UPI002AB832B6|nr:hypothetical protein [Hydrogenophaga sp.]MDZ4102930.1 hypothetical protein [Hydrogenophaga sp.]
MRWAIEIQNTQLDSRNLADLLGGLGCVLALEAPHAAFSSSDIDQCSNAEEAYEIAKRVRDAFVGPAGIDKAFRLGSVIDYSIEPARRHAFLEVQAGMYAMSSIEATLTVGPPQGLTADQLKKWAEERLETEYQAKLDEQLSKLEPAFFSPRAAKVLELLSIRSPTGEILFKIYELMKAGRSNREAFGQQFGISDAEYKRFSEAVHKDSVSGDWARHAHGDPPAMGVDPMSKSEAEAFVRRIARMWLKHVQMCGRS